MTHLASLSYRLVINTNTFRGADTGQIGRRHLSKAFFFAFSKDCFHFTKTCGNKSQIMKIQSFESHSLHCVIVSPIYIVFLFLGESTGAVFLLIRLMF